MSKGHSGYFHGTRGDQGVSDLGGLFAGASINGYPLVVHKGQQGKHIVGNNNYIEGRSIFFGSVDDAQNIIREFAGKGQWQKNSNKEVVDAERIIGFFVDRDTGKKQLTTRFTIHYSKNGAHIVPARPKPKKEG